MSTSGDSRDGKTLETIEAVPGELSQVLLNLMSNAIHAACKRTARLRADPDRHHARSRLSGRSPRGRQRDRNARHGPPWTFVPFFTTKPAREGTGLGLSLSFDIVVKQHGGQLTVDSKFDTFTEFTVTLPRRVAEGATP